VKRNVLIWASVGFLVAAGWALLPLLMGPGPLSTTGPLWTLIEMTCPVVLASLHFHFPVYFLRAIVANAVTYALLGALVETLRHSLRTA